MSISGALNLVATGSLDRFSGNIRPGTEGATSAIPETPEDNQTDATTGAAGEVEAPEQSGQGLPPLAPRSLVDPANLSQAQETAEETEAAAEDGESLTISARLVPVGDEESTESVALDGRPEAVKSGELVSESQKLTGEPLEIPDYSIDPAQRDIEVFNERISRSTQVLQFLNSRPTPSSGVGVSIIA